MKLSVVMPVYNEHRTVEECIRRVMAVPYQKEVIPGSFSPSKTIRRMSSTVPAGGARDPQ